MMMYLKIQIIIKQRINKYKVKNQINRIINNKTKYRQIHINLMNKKN